MTAKRPTPPHKLDAAGHSVARFIERHLTPDFDRDAAAVVLMMILMTAELVAWEQGDLDGRGQGVWRCTMTTPDGPRSVMVSADWEGVVRTVLPRAAMSAMGMTRGKS